MKRFSCILFLATIASAQDNSHWVLLPPGAAPEAARQCSRQAPKVEGAWTPSPADIAGLEQRLPALAKLTGSSTGKNIQIAHPEQAYRQYVGIVSGGRRYIYINAVVAPFTGLTRQHIDIVCDGGWNFWGALYDPATQQFSDLQTNGYA